MIATYQRLKRRRDAGEIDGFTLIELLIVIVVLGILAAVVIFALGGITGKSQVAACQADGATVSTAIAAFVAQNPTFTISGLQEADLTTADTNNANQGPYIQSFPSATVADNGYAYSLDATTGALTVTTAGGIAKSGIPYAGPQDCAGA